MHGTTVRTPRSLNPLLERAGRRFAQTEVVSRLPDRSVRSTRMGARGSPIGPRT
jgi:hypothetical protein